MTGYRMGPGDAVLAGFGDVQVASGELARTGGTAGGNGRPFGDQRICRTGRCASPCAASRQDQSYFSKESALECLQALEADSGEWEIQTAKLIRRSCPLSVACAFEIIRRARELKTIEDALALEYRFTSRSMSDGEFIEGVRAQIIDKDRNPQWADRLAGRGDPRTDRGHAGAARGPGTEFEKLNGATSEFGPKESK